MEDQLFDHLYQNIKHGRLEAVQAYLDAGGYPDLCNRNGWSLLMATAFSGNSRILTALLDREAVLEITNVAGETALSLAAGGGHAKCVRLLLARGASVSVRPLGWPLSQFMKHARCPSAEVDELLADAGAG